LAGRQFIDLGQQGGKVRCVKGTDNHLPFLVRTKDARFANARDVGGGFPGGRFVRQVEPPPLRSQRWDGRQPSDALDCPRHRRRQSGTGRTLSQKKASGERETGTAKDNDSDFCAQEGQRGEACELGAGMQRNVEFSYSTENILIQDLGT
jgi:hypothetical protein